MQHERLCFLIVLTNNYDTHTHIYTYLMVTIFSLGNSYLSLCCVVIIVYLYIKKIFYYYLTCIQYVRNNN